MRAADSEKIAEEVAQTDQATIDPVVNDVPGNENTRPSDTFTRDASSGDNADIPGKILKKKTDITIFTFCIHELQTPELFPLTLLHSNCHEKVIKRLIYFKTNLFSPELHKQD